MTANRSAELPGFLDEHMAQASPDLLRDILSVSAKSGPTTPSGKTPL